MKLEHDSHVAVQWLRQLQGGAPSLDITATFAAQLIKQENAATKELLMDIQRTSSEEVDALWEAIVDDEVPAVTVYPKPNLAFLPSSSQHDLFFAAMQSAMLEMQSAVTERITHISDQLYGVFAFVGRSTQGRQTLTVTVSRGTTRSLDSVEKPFVPYENLLRYELGKREGFGWEMEVRVAAETPEHCNVEVSILDPEKTVANIPITLYDGEHTRTQLTNKSGCTTFTKIDRKQLEKLIVHRTLND